MIRGPSSVSPVDDSLDSLDSVVVGPAVMVVMVVMDGSPVAIALDVAASAVVGVVAVGVPLIGPEVSVPPPPSVSLWSVAIWAP